MSIYLYNSLNRKKEIFEPIDPQNIRLYVCGPTVYDRAHLGNARPALVFDMLFRLLRHEYGTGAVTYVRNFTDVDDKINASALARRYAGAKGSLEELIASRSDETISWYHEDMDSLGILRPSHEPRATQFILQMIAMIDDLIKKGFAYVNDGHVFFSVRKYEDYGDLSKRPFNEMMASARSEIISSKNDPLDFVLWKPSNDELPGWKSPWGRGRPGWHIECSSMALHFLGSEFDIHGGGGDLIFPHHENEIAQSKCAGHGFARIWMHNEMLRVEKQKMAKSLSNFFTVRDLLDQGIPGEVIRFIMLSTHYRKPMDWNEKKRVEAENTLRQFQEITKGVEPTKINEEFLGFLRDDLNTPGALFALRKIAKEGDPGELLASANMMGILDEKRGYWWHEEEILPGIVVTGSDANWHHARSVAEQAKIWQDLRRSKDFDKADKIRDDFLDFGVELRSVPSGIIAYMRSDSDPAKLNRHD